MSEPPGSTAGRPEGDLLSTVVVPVADQDDARATARSLAGLLDDDDRAVVVHVVQHTKGGLDTASVEQLEADAESIFAAAVEEYDTVCVGATRAGAVSQALFGSLPERVGAEVDATVAMVRGEEGSPRTIREAIVERLSP